VSRARARPAPALLGCALAGVRLAWVDLDAAPEAEDALAATLARDERERAARFRFAHDRRRYVVARATLRALLGRELGLPPAAVPLTADAYGKPRLASELGARLSFNLSHTVGRALYALAEGPELGVDAEAIRPLAEMEALARDVFSREELLEWSSLADEERTSGFFSGWTRKEAFVKALGRGLDYPLAAFAVTLAPASQPRLLRLRADAGASDDWRLLAFSPEPGYLAAVVASR
jgi:4'-phosphopantetheinyl transferase